MIWDLVERYHWTIEYARGVKMSDIIERNTIIEAKTAALNERARRDAFLKGK